MLSITVESINKQLIDYTENEFELTKSYIKTEFRAKINTDTPRLLVALCSTQECIGKTQSPAGSTNVDPARMMAKKTTSNSD